MSLVPVGNMVKVDGREHMDRIAQLPCCVSGLKPVAVHHIDSKRKAHDLLTIPIHHLYHQGLLGIHTLGAKAWQMRFGCEYSLLVKTWDVLGSEYVAEVKALLLADPKIRRRCETHGGQRLRDILEG